MADKIKGITVQIGGDTGPLSKALQGVNKEIKDTQTRLKEVEKLLKLDPTDTNLLKEKQKLLADQIKSTKKELDALKQAQKEAAQMLKTGEIGQEQYEQLSKKVDKAEKSLENLEKEAADVEKKMKPTAEKIGQYFESAGDKIEAAGKKFAPFSAAAAGGLVAGVKAASDWESAFTGVQKTVDATEEEYAELAEGIKELATRTSSSAEDIAAVAEAAGQLGVGKDDLLDFVETMVALGDTTNVSATDAAVALARFTTVTGSSKKDVKKLGSAVVALGNNFATDEASIINMSQKLAAAGKIAGLSETDILALAASMSSVGIEAEAGGTAMTQTLTGIEKAVSDTSKNGKKKLETLARVAGMSADDFTKAWKNDPITAVQAFIGGLGALDAQGESSTAVLDELGMSGVRQSNMLKSLGLASETLATAIGTASTAYEDNNALTEEASKRYGTFESQAKQTKEMLKQVAIDIGEIVMPVVKDLMTGVKNVVTRFKNLDDGTKETIVTIMGIVAAVSPVLTIVGKLTKGIGSAVSAFRKLGTFMSGIGGPITLAAAAIGGLVAAVVSHKNKLKNITKEHAKLSDAAQALSDKINAEATSWIELKSARKDSFKDIGTQTQKEKDLWEQLQKIVDENGKVREGYEKEAELITKDLSEALGIEINLIDGQITNYKELKSGIEDVIRIKQAEALLKADEEAYTKALKGRKDAASAVREAEYNLYVQHEKVAKQEEEVARLERDLAAARKEANDETGVGAARVQDLTNRLQEAQAALEGDRQAEQLLTQDLQTANDTLAGYDVTISNHDKLQAAVASGSTSDLQEAVYNLTNEFATAESANAETLGRQTKTLMEEYKKQREIVKTTGSQAAKDASYEMGTLVNKSIAELEKLDPKLAAEMRKELNTINKSSQEWNRSGANNAKSYTSGFKSNLNLSVEDRIKAALDLKESAYKWGSDMMANFAKGVEKTATKATEASWKAAKDIKKVLGFSEPEEGPLSDFHTYGPDMMQLLASGIEESKYQVMQAAQGVAAGLKASLEGTTLTAQLDQKSIPLASGVTLNIANFNNYSDSDIRELTNEIMETAANFAARKGAVFA